jgi:predicted regulator of Ras-like GTPase activity (Roadblock/LC7/MglB family)
LSVYRHVPADGCCLEVIGVDGDRQDKLEEALRTLLEKTQDIDAAAVVSLDGFVMASVLPSGYEADRLGAMSAALLSLGERTAMELGRGELAQVFVEGTQGYIFLLAAGEDAVLTAIVRRGSKLGLVLYDIRNAAKSIAALIESDLQVEYE